MRKRNWNTMVLKQDLYHLDKGTVIDRIEQNGTMLMLVTEDNEDVCIKREEVELYVGGNIVLCD